MGAIYHIPVWYSAARHHLSSTSAPDVRRAVRPGGHVLVATFGPEGPKRCSDLEVVRYDADKLHDEFGPEFRKIGSLTEMHRTPWGTEQQFVYCYCRLKASYRTSSSRPS